MQDSQPDCGDCFGDATKVPELPDILQFHFADLSAPLLQSVDATLPPNVADIPAYLSNYLSENSRWSDLKASAEKMMANSNSESAGRIPAPALAQPPPIVLRVRGPPAHRVRLERSLSSQHVGTLRAGEAFAFSHVGQGWAKLSPMHFDELRTSSGRCVVSDFKNHDPVTDGYCITAVDSKDIFEEPSDEQKIAILARFSESFADRSNQRSSSTDANVQSTQWKWPCDRPPSSQYCDSGECVNMTVYISLALPLLQRLDCRLQWARFLRCALYFAYATSAPQQCSRRELLLQAIDRIDIWASALADHQSKSCSNSRGIDSDVEQMFRANHIDDASQEVCHMTAAEIAKILSVEMVLENYSQVLESGHINGETVLQCSTEELYELLLDAEREVPNSFDNQGRCIILEKLLSLKSESRVGIVNLSQLSDVHVKSKSETVFRTLRTIFPEDSKVLNLDLAAMSEWPDFASCKWDNRDIMIPYIGVMSVCGTSFLHTSEFARFFPRKCFGALNVLKTWILPPYFNEVANNMLLAQISELNNIPSIKSSSRENCAIIAVVSGLSDSTLNLDIACKLLPVFRPTLPLPLIRNMLELYQQLFASQRECDTTIYNLANVGDSQYFEFEFSSKPEHKSPHVIILAHGLAAKIAVGRCDGWVRSSRGLSANCGRKQWTLQLSKESGCQVHRVGVATGDFNISEPSDADRPFGCYFFQNDACFANGKKLTDGFSRDPFFDKGDLITLELQRDVGTESVLRVYSTGKPTGEIRGLPERAVLYPVVCVLNDCQSYTITPSKSCLGRSANKNSLSQVVHTSKTLVSGELESVSMDNPTKFMLLQAIKLFLDPARYQTRLPTLKRVAQLALSFAKCMPFDVMNCGIVDLLLKFEVKSDCLLRQMIFDTVRAVTDKMCKFSCLPNDPHDILYSHAPNNWPDVLKNYISNIHSAGHKTYKQLVCAFLCGKSAFRRSFAEMHPAIIDAIHHSISNHFSANCLSSLFYHDCILSCCKSGFKLQLTSGIDETAFVKGDYGSSELVTLTRTLIRLVLSGNVPFSLIAPCHNFLQACARLQDSTAELELLYAASDAIFSAIIPALDPKNNQPFHIVLLPRAVFELSANFGGLNVSRILVDDIVVDNVVLSFGWCERLNDDESIGSASKICVSLLCGNILNALKNFPCKSASVSDLSAATRLHVETVSSCLRTLADMGIVQNQLSTANTCHYDENFTFTQDLSHAKSHVALSSFLPSPSPISTDRVDTYIEMCHHIFSLIVQKSDQISKGAPVTEAQLISSISSSKSFHASDVAGVVNHMVARNVLQRTWTGEKTIVSLPVADNAVHSSTCFSDSEGERELDKCGSFIFDTSECGLFQKVVVFVISDSPSRSGAESLHTKCMLSLNPSSCVEFGNKFAAETLISRTIDQLCSCLGLSFLMAAKELMNEHGYAERVLIKYVDAQLHSKMFAVDLSSGPEIKPTTSIGNDACLVCLDNEDLIRLPCHHFICENDFNARFLSDRSQNVYGALPDDQTPSAADEENGRPDFFSCPLCSTPLGVEFWSEFPTNLTCSQRNRPVSLQVTLDHVHRRIVANTLRVLRQDPLASIARDESQSSPNESKLQRSGHYIATLNTEHPISCQGRPYNNIGDVKCKDPLLRDHNHNRDWEILCQKIKDEIDRSSNQSKISSNSKSQGDEDEGSMQPVFISDQDRPQSEEGRLNDFRMCPQCFFGNFVNLACNTMGTHHGEQNTINCCPKCGFFSNKWSDWPRSDDRLKNHSFKCKLPFLSAVTKCVASLDSALSHFTLDTPCEQSRELFTASPSKQLCTSILGRQFIRDELLHLRRICISASFSHALRGQNDILKDLSSAEKHTTLLLLLLQLKDGFVKSYVEKASILEKAGGCKHPMYIVHAALLASFAIKSWSPDFLDKFLIGDLGTPATALANVKASLDGAAKNIPVMKVFLDSDVPVPEALVQYVFSYEGCSSHEIMLFNLISKELRGSIFFDALLKSNSVTVATVARLFFQSIPYPRLMVLITSGNFVSALSVILYFINSSNYAFLRPPSIGRRNLSDISDFVHAATEHALGARQPKSSNTSQLVALLNQKRKVTILKGPEAPSDDAPVHVSIDAQGCMVVCGITKKSIRIFHANGSFKCDLSIKKGDGSPMQSQFLRASTIDWSTGYIYVTDRDADSIHCIKPDGELIVSTPPGLCAKPRGLSWCARTRRVAVADYENHQVIILDSELKVLSILKGASHADKFQNPIDTSFDVNGFLYIVDSRNNRVVVMNDALNHMLSFGSKGQSDGAFENPTGICVDGSGKVFVSCGKRLQVFDRAGKYIVTYTPESLATEGSDLYGVSVSLDGRLLICSQGNKSLLQVM